VALKPVQTRQSSQRTWDEDEDGNERQAHFKPLTQEEAQALREKEPPLSPWRVVLVQVVVGVVAALLAGLHRREEVAWSALYGAATVVLPGGLDGARHDQPALQHVARHQCRQLHVVGDGEDRGFGRHADAGAEARAAPELAGVAGGPGAVHEGVLGRAAVARRPAKKN
jgi:hypothetical protein